MAKKKKKKKYSDVDEFKRLSGAMRYHLWKLGFSTVEDYKLWCRQHNFSCGLNKNVRQRSEELFTFSSIDVSQIMANEKKGRNLKEVIPKIYKEKLDGENLRNPIAKEIAFAFERSNCREDLLHLMLYIGENSDLLKEISYIKGIEMIANHADSWLRPLEAWHVKRHNRDWQFCQLLRHLFAKYDIPHFMDRVWLTENETHQNWYKHIGSGQNIRTAPEMPITLTKKMAHHFLSAPRHYNVDEALRWGQVQALGGDKRLVDALRGTRLITDYSHDDFWLNVVRFFIENPMLDVMHVNPIVDFIWNHKFANQRVFVDRGVMEEIGPPQPNFNMRGRTPRKLLRQVNDWHRQLGKEAKQGSYEWEHSDIGDFVLKEQRMDNYTPKYWRIRELLSTDELIEEGRAMKHCVSSYSESCFTGKTSIWSMETEDEYGRNNVLTIEVLMAEKLVRQARGKRNRLPSMKEGSMLKRWVRKEQLEIADYVKFAGE